MAAKDFYFALTIPASSVPSPLVDDLVARVCDACAAPDTKAELIGQIETAVGQLEGDCELRFESRGGALDVAIRAGARQVWQTSRPID